MMMIMIMMMMMMIAMMTMIIPAIFLMMKFSSIEGKGALGLT